MEKTIKSRIIHKHDTEANWNEDAITKPSKGEIIVYDTDDNYSYERIKIGNGVSLVKDLPFVIEKSQTVYVGPEEPTDPNIKVWINTSEDGTGVIPVLPRISTITLYADSWTGAANPYSQPVSINTVTSATKIDLQPTAQQIVALQNADIALMAENNGGTVTIYALGGKPSVDYTMQVLLTEVSYV